VIVGLVAFIGARLGQPQPPPVTLSPSSIQPASPPPESPRTGTPPAPGGTFTQPNQPPSPGTPPPPPPGPTRPPGDLGLAQPISQPACNGQGIVILGNITTPGLYAAGVQQLLDAHPGAYYLRTDQSCPSLRRANEQGNPIYAVFEPAGTTRGEVCDAVQRAGGGAYGKWLDYTHDPGYIIPC
jgi:serine/threonine protein kinase, bacterial